MQTLISYYLEKCLTKCQSLLGSPIILTSATGGPWTKHDSRVKHFGLLVGTLEQGPPTFLVYSENNYKY